MATATPAAPVISAPARLIALATFWGGLAVSTVGLLISLSTYGRPGSYLATPFGEVAGFVFSVSLLATGYLLRSRRPANSLGWLFLAFGVAATIAAGAWTVMLVEYLPGGDRHLGAMVSLLGAVVCLISWPYLIVALVIRFPHGNPSTASDARLLRGWPIVCVAFALTAALRPGRILAFAAFDNPLPVPGNLQPVLLLVSNAVALAAIVPVCAASIGMVRRYRRAASIERLQLRWFAFGASGVLVATTLFLVAALLWADVPFIREGTYALMVVSLTGLPVAVFQAIATHRLYDIDRIIGRTFAFGALTAILAGLYSASIRLFNWLFVDLTGQESEIALVLTTLILATSFTPIKSRLETAAEKRFKFAEADAAAAAADRAASPAGPEATTGIMDGARVELDADALAALEARIGDRIDAAVRRAVDDALAARPRAAAATVEAPAPVSVEAVPPVALEPAPPVA